MDILLVADSLAAASSGLMTTTCDKSLLTNSQLSWLLW